VRCRLLAEAAGRPRPGRLSVPTSGVPTGRALLGGLVLHQSRARFASPWCLISWPGSV